MSGTMILKAEKREKTGTKATRKLRDAGKIPAIIYGHKVDPVSVALDAHDLNNEIQHHHRLLQVELDGKAEQYLLKDVQFDYLGDTIIHIDLNRVDMDERVSVTVEVVLKGTPAGLSEGGILEQVATEIELECLVTNIPENIRAQVDGLGVGENLLAGAIELPAGMTLVSDPDLLVAAVRVVAEEPEEGEEAAAGSDEPEVIGSDKEEGTEE